MYMKKHSFNTSLNNYACTDRLRDSYCRQQVNDYINEAMER